MKKLADYNLYNKRMSRSFWDKCWWLDKITDDVEVIIDFGCADGEIFRFIDGIFPGRFYYIGVDNDAKMRSLAQDNLQDFPKAIITSSLTKFKVFSGKSILLLNSVLHEVFSYNSEGKVRDFFDEVKVLAPDFIAIRDMNLDEESLETMDFDKMKNEFYCSPVKDLMGDFVIESKRELLDFSLKYRYSENLEVEKREQYLWNVKDKIRPLLGGDYEIEFESRYYLPFLRRSLRKDLGILFPKINTHTQLLLERIDSQWEFVRNYSAVYYGRKEQNDCKREAGAGLYCDD